VATSHFPQSGVATYILNLNLKKIPNKLQAICSNAIDKHEKIKTYSSENI
jgi:hypothetical protein